MLFLAQPVLAQGLANLTNEQRIEFAKHPAECRQSSTDLHAADYKRREATTDYFTCLSVGAGAACEQRRIRYEGSVNASKAKLQAAVAACEFDTAKWDKHWNDERDKLRRYYQNHQ